MMGGHWAEAAQAQQLDLFQTGLAACHLPEGSIAAI
jgi:hypothetical protein